MNWLLNTRQFLSDTVSTVDLWLIFSGAAVALMLAWFF
jgi:hypothetical protein